MGRTEIHAALADEHRLAIADALVLGDLSPGELADILGVSSNLLAHHLGVLEDAGVVRRLRSEGDARRTYVSLNADDPIVAATVGAPPHLDALRIVFVCTSNSARSPMAASLLAASCPLPVASAGTAPGTAYREGAVAALRTRGLSPMAAGPAGVDDVVRGGDLIVAVCDRAYEAMSGAGAPAEASSRPMLHWSIPDPAQAEGADAFDRAAARLETRVARLASSLTEGTPG